MLVKNKGIFLTDRLSSINVPINTSRDKVVSEIMDYNLEVFLSNTISDNIGMPTVLFISDRLEDMNKVIPSVVLNSQEVTISAINALQYTNRETLPDWIKSNHMSIIIVGYINNIPKYILENIINQHPLSKICLFGDETINSPEYNNYQSLYLTNSEMQMTHSYSEFKNSQFKKINSILSKLRDRKSRTLDIVSASANTIKYQSDTVDIDLVLKKLKQDFTIVVPRRVFTTVNSATYNMSDNKQILNLDAGMTVYNRFPFVINNISIPAFSKIFIEPSDDLFTIDNNQKIVLRNITATIGDDSVYIQNVPINFTRYLMSFESNRHIFNQEDFEQVSEYVNYDEYNPFVMDVLPFKIITSIEQKYLDSKSLLVFLETVDSDYYNIRNTWFQELCNVEEYLEIVYNDIFELEMI